MFRLLLHEPTWLFAVLLLLLLITLACLPLLVMRKRIPFDRLHEHREIIGITYGVVGVFYSLLFAFVLIGVWEDYEEAEANVFETTSAIDDILDFATDAGPEHEQQLKDACKLYLEATLQEWDSRDYTEAALHLEVALRHLNRALHQTQQNVPALSGHIDPIFRTLSGLELASQERISIRDSHVPGLIWWVICLGSIICIGFLYLFKVNWFRLHMSILAVVTLVIGLNLIIVYLLDHPFSGSTSVSPSPLIELLNSI